jgi:hypothetical protein
VGKFKCLAQMLVHVLEQLNSPQHAALLSGGQRVQDWNTELPARDGRKPKSLFLEKLLKAYVIPDFGFAGVKVARACLALEGPPVALELLPVCSVSPLTTACLADRWLTFVFTRVGSMRNAQTAAAN